MSTTRKSINGPIKNAAQLPKHYFKGKYPDDETYCAFPGCDYAEMNDIHQNVPQHPTSEMTQLEQFVQFHANESSNQLHLERHFAPDSSGGTNMVEQSWLMMDDRGTEWAVIVTDRDGAILHFEFNYTASGNVSPVPFLIATIQWLTETALRHEDELNRKEA